MFVLVLYDCTRFKENPKPIIKATNVPEEGIVIDKWQVQVPFLEENNYGSDVYAYWFMQCFMHCRITTDSEVSVAQL